MKKQYYFLIICCVLLSACASSKSTAKHSKSSSKADNIVAYAMQYKGVPYRYGGTTRKGMDCSGVVYVAFGSQNISLPRVSKDMAKKGRNISLKNVQKGDLVFFKISRLKNRINHVGLVISNKNGVVLFIHSTSSKGVIVSSMNQKYWKKTFVKATTIL